jgi:RIO-like serine/threonine protein kinase
MSELRQSCWTQEVSLFLSTAEEQSLRGVLHNDLSSRNIILTPPEMPTHAMLIDFGQATTGSQTARYTREEWLRFARHKTEPEGIRHILIRILKFPVPWDAWPLPPINYRDSDDEI